VLCYHRIGGPLEIGVTRVSPAVFRRQMEALARDGWRTLTLVEYESRLACPLSPVARPEVLITFDDGDAGLARHAYPVLADLGYTAITFLVTDFVGRLNTWDARYTWRRLPHLDWSAVARWRERGFEFGSHGATHRRLTWLDDDTAREELERSRSALRARLGEGSATAIAYPFGASVLRVRRLAREVGYRLGFGGGHGADADPLDQRRVGVYAWDRAAPPLGVRGGPLGVVGRLAARAANRCSVGTSLILRVGRWL
jgi:peptidoglycan/xylan/chitin deacetylase (PgdA/CDA1 family)